MASSGESFYSNAETWWFLSEGSYLILFLRVSEILFSLKWTGQGIIWRSISARHASVWAIFRTHNIGTATSKTMPVDTELIKIIWTNRTIPEWARVRGRAVTSQRDVLATLRFSTERVMWGRKSDYQAPTDGFTSGEQSFNRFYAPRNEGRAVWSVTVKLLVK